jgi:glycine betaine/choline ABC-type transport system substrate-binding protein
VKHSESSAEEVVDALLEDQVDPKEFILERMPSFVDQALSDMEKLFYREYRHGMLKNADHADDRAIEIAGEIASNYRIETAGDPFDQLLQRAFRLGHTVRPLFQ